MAQSKYLIQSLMLIIAIIFSAGMSYAHEQSHDIGVVKIQKSAETPVSYSNWTYATPVVVCFDEMTPAAVVHASVPGCVDVAEPVPARCNSPPWYRPDKL